MKIITPGRLPDDEVYKCTCRNCHTVFEFEVKEARLGPTDPRDGTALIYVRCPLEKCGYENCVAQRPHRHYPGRDR